MPISCHVGVVARVNMKVFSSLPSFGGKVNGALLLQVSFMSNSEKNVTCTFIFFFSV